MARSGFKPSYTGYRAVMNGQEVMDACQLRGESLAASASRQTGTDYDVNTRPGINRAHTRVTTVGVSDYFRERHYRGLSIALGSAGGQPSEARRSGYRTLMSRVAAADRKWFLKQKNTGWRSPGLYRGRRR